MVTKPHPIITTVPYHDVSIVTVLDIDCTSFFSYLSNFLLRNPFYGHLQVGENWAEESLYPDAIIT